MFKFKRKNKSGDYEDAPVSQQEFEALEAGAQTLETLTALFGDDAQAEDFDLASSIQSLIEENDACAEAFGTAAAADGFTPKGHLTELRAAQTELNGIAKAVEHLEGATTLDKVKAIQPEGKSTTTETEATVQTQDQTRFQSFEHNKDAAKELAARGVRLVGFDYSNN